MAENEKISEPVRPTVELRNSQWAALLAWLWPGAGHIYQGRYAKGALFMICILGTFVYGLMLGSGRVVYASWKPNDYRWQYACQLGVGLPAFPAMAQSMKTRDGGKPHWVLAERFPEEMESRKFEIMTTEELAAWQGATLTDGWMAPPAGPTYPGDIDVLGKWHEELLHRFELGTLFTVIAGLLNILAIYDAYAGPAFEETAEEREQRRKKSKKNSGESEDPANADKKK